MKPLTTKDESDVNRTREPGHLDNNSKRMSIEVTVIFILITNIIVITYPLAACIYSKLIYDAPCMSREHPRPPPEEDADNERLNIVRISQFISN